MKLSKIMLIKNFLRLRRVALTQSQRPRGRLRLTWIELMGKQTTSDKWEEASHHAKDRKKWKDILRR